ncbi:MAG TPA: DUF4349 domain-containing protein [Jatrophihabitans sp.]|nr:DUF4349 domain-containing protein [Jatrophihabitans sp.]
MRTRGWLAISVLAVLAAVLALSACTNGGNQASQSGRAEVNAAAGGSTAGRSGAGSSSLAGAAGGAGSTTGQRATTLSLDSGAQIRTAEMTVAVQGGVGAQADRAILIAQQAGGEVNADERTSGPHATATLQLRVPPDALEPTLASLAKLGSEQSRRLSTTDVTQRVADVNSRVASAEEAIAGLRGLYRRTQKIADIISIETELSSRQSDLESLQAQQRALDRQTSMATITLTLVTARKHAVAPPLKPRHHTRGGFIGGVERGWHGFTAAAGWVAAALGTLLPFLLTLLALGVGARLLWPRLSRLSRRRAPTAAE